MVTLFDVTVLVPSTLTVVSTLLGTITAGIGYSIVFTGLVWSVLLITVIFLVSYTTSEMVVDPTC